MAEPASSAQVPTAVAAPPDPASELEGAAVAQDTAQGAAQPPADDDMPVSLRPNAPPVVDEALAKEIVRQVWPPEQLVAEQAALGRVGPTLPPPPP